MQEPFAIVNLLRVLTFAGEENEDYVVFVQRKVEMRIARKAGEKLILILTTL